MTFRQATRKIKKLANGEAFSVGKNVLTHSNGDLIKTYSVWIEGWRYHNSHSFEQSIADLMKEMNEKREG